MASATNTVCSGEILQTRHRRNFELSRKEYFRVLEMKTAELFALSCDMAGFRECRPGAPHGAAEVRHGFRRGVSKSGDDCVDLFGTENRRANRWDGSGQRFDLPGLAGLGAGDTRRTRPLEALVQDGSRLPFAGE